MEWPNTFNSLNPTTPHTLRASFGIAYNPSAWFQKAQQHILKGIAPGEYLGGGTHFLAWKLTLLKTPLVLKISRNRWGEAKKGEYSIEKRFTIWKELSSSDIWLIPPFDIFRCEDRVVMIMLWGEDFSEANLSPQFRPWQLQVDRMHSELKAHGFASEDLEQWKSWSGVPFLCDLSDISKER